jgi:ACS family glucarate transporter-like MFS transporter
MNSLSASPEKPTRVRYGVLAFACTLAMIQYLDRVCIGTVAKNIESEFALSKTQIGLIFFAFTLAYAVFEIPTGWLGDVFGPRKTLLRIILWWSSFTALTGLIYPIPSAPWLAFTILFLVRFMFGVGEAGCFPNIARAFHNWFPFTERGFAQGAVWMAGRLGGGITPFLVLALIYDTGAEGAKVTHWRHTFWIFGCLGLVWSVFFWLRFRDRPEQEPRVNAAELAMIQHGESHEPAHKEVPWLRLFSNRNLWLLCLMYFCGAYGWYFNITYLPNYLSTTFGLEKNAPKWSAAFWQFSFMAGAPLLFGSLACIFGGILTDSFIRRTGNRKWGRRLFGIVGHGICALCYFLCLFADNAWFFVLAVAMAAFWNDITMGSAWASCLDIGKKYSGIVAGCMNTIGNLGGAAANIITGVVLDLTSPAGGDATTPNPQGWTYNFLLFTGVYLLATILWCRFDSTKPVLPELASPPAEQAD